MDHSPRITAEGDGALAVRFASAPNPRARDLVRAAAEALRRADLPSACEIMPSYTAVTVVYDPLDATFDQMGAAVLGAVEHLGTAARPPRRTVVVPVCYGCADEARELGPDLEALALSCGLAPGEVAALHAAPTYRIDMLGFMPGFAYLSGLDERLRCPRLATPRTAIPAGSVGIGNDQTGVYPLASPGGWHLIGRTPARLFDPTRAEPVPYRAGDALRFEPVDAATFRALAAQEACGRSCLRFEDAAEQEADL